MELYLVCHGETQWNVQDRLRGREEIPLNENGKAQARACALALRGLEVQKILSSPLGRALETAQEIAKYHACPAALEPDLIERDYGRLTGLTAEERERRQIHGLPDQAEPWRNLAGRAMAAVERCSKELDENGRAIIVSHEGWINAVLAVVSAHTAGTGKTKLNCGGISVLRREESGWRIACHNLSPDEYAVWAAEGKAG